MEHKLLSAILHSREAYEKLQNTVLKSEDFTDAGRIIVENISGFYSRDPEAKRVDPEIILQKLESAYPKQIQLFSQIIGTLEPVSVPNIIDVYVNLKLQSTSNKLMGLLASGKKQEEVIELMDSYKKLVEQRDAELFSENEYNIYINRPVENIIESLRPENLITVSPNRLNEVLRGGIDPGRHVVVFARPEMGKTLFNINLACHILEQGRKVVYVGNEDPVDSMLARFINRLSLMDRYQVIANPQRAYREALDKGYENLVFVEATPGTVVEVDKWAEQYGPDVMVVDQIRNLTPKKQYSRVENLEYIAQELRETYKRYNIVGISITQAGDSAENKAVLDQGDVDFSNTGIPATADLMVGLGATPQQKDSGFTMISLAKNKISAVREYFSVIMNPWLSTVQDAE